MHRNIIEEIITTNEWRLGEFAKMRMNAQSVEESLWCRMCIPMIYAHWEGYIVASLKILIDHLNELQLLAERIPTKLVVLGLGDTYRTLSGKQSFVQRIAFTEKFKGLLKTTVIFQKKINTKSNLKADVLEELCTSYGFDFRSFAEVTNDINRLVSIRNSIAHGENSVLPDMDNVNKYINSVMRGHDILKGQIEIFISRQDYLLPEPPERD